ncbi:MAG: acetyl-CoA decarbonylase/synthase complex subunit delta [Chloroflexi bacterium]|nr:acetyl-CoA decarbonylase/synthase complex subunit delta [Chloroflexota bacterium]MBM3176039.1 acetyl-CoA decarbonylase/synthase complex subunit delta [Chloroflexota bacterium]MBM3182863.1 acetyl-CoA decarbonylase/synthase complex subunit delta [Chloroflexota bacterium]
MDYKAPLETYTGKVAEVVIGKGDKAIKIGGESVLPFHFFEGTIANRPRLALEVLDAEPEGWAQWLIAPYKDVTKDPVAWAKKTLGYGADLVMLRLVSTDPGGANASADKAAATVKQVAAAISTPLVVYGSGDENKDIEVLAKVAEACSGEGLLLGPVVKENYEPISKAAMEHGHSIVAQSPLDINLEKELNVKLLKSMPANRIVIDPLSSALGYGMEYSFTIMERTKHIGVMFGDNTMQMPIIADLGAECWKTKQAKESEKQGLLWESITALSLLLAGANLLVMRHPETCKLMKEAIEGKI